MTPKEKTEQLIGRYKYILINSDTDAGEEIICTLIAKQCALISVDEVLGYMGSDRGTEFWQEVKIEIEKL